MVKACGTPRREKTPPEDFRPAKIVLSGLEVLAVHEEPAFLIAGERTNVAGSRKFARLIGENKYDQALEIAGTMVQDGAHILDINMDDAMLDAPAAMKEFLLRLVRILTLLRSTDVGLFQLSVGALKLQCV